jgi:hypothetical protein
VNARVLIPGACGVLTWIVLASSPAAPATQWDAMLAAVTEQAAAAPASDGLLLHAQGELWYQPLAVYPAALLLRAGIPRDLALTLPSLAAAYAVIWLTFALGVRLPLSTTAAALAAALLVLMPGFVAHAHTPGAALLMTAAILGWCVGVLDYAVTRRGVVLIAAASTLALAAYTQPAGFWAVAMFFTLGAAVLRRTGASWAAVLTAVAAIAAVWLPLAAWVLLHPVAYPDTLGRWAIHAAHVRSPLEGLQAVTRLHVVARRASEYWSFFSPTFLFASAQVFTWWMLLLVPPGLWMRPETPAAWLVVVGFVVTPVAAVMLDTGRSAMLAVTLLPFGVLLALRGVTMGREAVRRRQMGHFRRAASTPSSN